METKAEYVTDETGFISIGKGPTVEIRLDDLAFLIEAGKDAAWESVRWPEYGARASLDKMSDEAEKLLLEIATAKRRIKAARRILRALFPGDEKYKDEFWKFENIGGCNQ